MGRRAVGVESCVAVPATAKQGRCDGEHGRGRPCDEHGLEARGIKKPRPQVAGLNDGVGGIWLWMGGEKK